MLSEHRGGAFDSDQCTGGWEGPASEEVYKDSHLESLSSAELVEKCIIVTEQKQSSPLQMEDDTKGS